MTSEDQAAIFTGLVVVENHPGLRPRERPLLAVHDNSRQLGVVRDHEPERAIRLNNIDALNGQLLERLPARVLEAMQQEDAEYRGYRTGIDCKKPLPFAHMNLRMERRRLLFSPRA